MDNQQERSKLIDLSWLGGIIDGEGTITLRLKRGKDRNTQIHPSIAVGNTNKVIIDKIIQVMKDNEIPHWVTYDDTKTNENWKNSWIISINGIRRAKKTLDILQPFIIGKQEELQIVLDYCNRRLNNPPKYTYTQEDVDALIKIKSLHGHKLVLKSSETIRGIDELRSSKDIVRTA